MIKAIIFDFDGVILDSNNLKTKAFKDLYKDIDKNDLKKILDFHKLNAGLSRFKKISYFQRNIIRKDYSSREIINKSKKFSNLVLNKIIKAKYINGAKKFITNNKSKKLLFISSGTPQIELKYISNKKKISIFFDGIYGSPNDKNLHIKNIKKKWDLKNKEILFIGDSIIDLTAASKFKLHFLAIGKDLIKHIKKNDYILDDLKFVNNVIKKIENN